MRIAAAALTLLCVALTATAFGAPPEFDTARLSATAPAQFYTNGKMINAWNRDADTKNLVTFWFGKNPKNSLTYRQLIVVQQPNDTKIYYFEVVDRVYVGRYDVMAGGVGSWPDATAVADYAGAGVTWWNAGFTIRHSLDEVGNTIRRGPPPGR